MYYLLFIGYDYYPSGGWDDFKGSFKTIGEAKVAASELSKDDYYDWYQIVDFAPNMGTQKVIFKARGQWDEDCTGKAPHWEEVK